MSGLPFPKQKIALWFDREIKMAGVVNPSMFRAFPKLGTFAARVCSRCSKHSNQRGELFNPEATTPHPAR